MLSNTLTGRATVWPLALAVAAILAPGAACAQSAPPAARTPAAAEAEARIAADADARLLDALLSDAHIALTERRPPAPGDSARAAALARELRRSLAKYKDVRAAEADGYSLFAPAIADQREYHYIHPGRIWREQREGVTTS